MPETSSAGSGSTSSATRKAECPECEGTGWRPVEKDGLRAVEVCSCRKEPDLTQCGFSAAHATGRLTDFAQQADVAKRVAALLGGKTAGMLVTGPVGTGKTRLLAAVCREFLVAGKEAEFVTSHGFFLRLRESYQERAETTESAVLRRFAEVPMLALDDLGREGKPSEHVLSFLHTILSLRLDNRRPTAITTNLTFEGIGAHYDQGIASRLGAYVPLALVGKDRRNVLEGKR